MGLKVQLFDIWSRLTKYDKKVGIIRNGEDNAYPDRIERFVNNSVTAKTACNIMATYLFGKGFGDVNNKIIVNPKKQLTLLKFTQKLAKNFSKQRGVFIHINYNANYAFSNFDILPYTHCRLGKKDDNKYSGKIGIHNNWAKDTIKVDDVEFIDVFNPNKAIIYAQVEATEGKTTAEKWANYKGQIWYVNLDDEYDYALSTIDAVINDCDSEAQASLYKNKSLRKGFFGKTVVITKPLAGNIEDYGEGKEGAILYANAISERTKFKETIESFIGSENAGGVLHIELENESDDIKNAINFENITSNIDDKIFEYTESSVFKNILMAFNNLPSGLVRSENTLFAQSGESIKVMREVYQENTSLERLSLEEVVKALMKNFTTKTDVELIPLIEVSKTPVPKAVPTPPNTTANANVPNK